MRRVVLALVAAALLLPATAHAGFYSQTTNVGDFEFNPQLGYADNLTGMRWEWITGMHSVTSYDGVFDSGSQQSPAPDFTYNFTAPGRYEYFCKVHGSSMEGAISVPPAADAEYFPELDADGDLRQRTPRAYTLGGAAVAVAPSLSLHDPDDDLITEAIVIISDGKQDGDVLDGPAGSDYDSTSGTLTVPGAPTDDDAIAALLQSVTFSTTGGEGTRRITFQATDADDGSMNDAEKAGNPDYIDVVVAAPPPSGNGGGDGGNGGGSGTPTTTTPSTPAPPPPSTLRPVALPPAALRLALTRSSFTVDRQGRFTLTFTTDPNARGTVDLLPAGSRARAAQARRYARASFRANARGRVSVRVRLSTAARRSLRRARTRRLRARLVVRRGAQSTTRAVTLRRRR
jgi:plastocyanin